MTGKEAIKRLQAAGWRLDRINGSHHIMYKPGYRPVAVPVHGSRDLGNGLLRSLERATGVKMRSQAH
ncbi:MAG: type II toxin-antitoxin system HicA family toxin [Gammaproteobacteria bacterium]|nr:type II toxin-antitoxin system HicA family toxin [Gammaproteobacteria bacterium]MBU6510196.1 type II toxin-antitoxin system HicA family toxin [Gammaproteobacteria bacterium]MDE2108848.1 type II toxin-antitoxin system HicA family toxin [Gammaproteobacteria bacterium]MDE2459621.1 type II toxin-antitoxin system HicA family toxin [Gammaproteobacteria bacterium]